MQEIGELLGFEAQRPEKMFHEGPDNLWKVSNNEYLLLSVKIWSIAETRSLVNRK